MSELRYTVGDLVILGVDLSVVLPDMYICGIVVEIVRVDTIGIPYQVRVPNILGYYPSIWVKEFEIDHEATAKLNKEQL